MVERIFGRVGRERVRRPAPVQAVPHTSKKPVLAVTGTKPDRICSICLGKLEPGIAITFCECGRFFHIACISELENCPLCGFSLQVEGNHGPIELDETSGADPADGDITEIVYQCPVCHAYVPEDSERCPCGAVFDMDEEEIYLCPQCGNEVGPDADRCDRCGLEYA